VPIHSPTVCAVLHVRSLKKGVGGGWPDGPCFVLFRQVPEPNVTYDSLNFALNDEH
jgi:hypothetical protein